MKKKIFDFLRIEDDEINAVLLLLVLSFFVGMFTATVTVASQSLFLNYFDGQTDLPIALAVAGALGMLTTGLFNFFQGRMSFVTLASIFLILIIFATSTIEFGENLVEDKTLLFYFGFTLILPFTYLTQLIFWNTVTRLFTLRQSKRIIGTVDIGMDVAQIIAFFSIPILLTFLDPEDLYFIGLICVVGFLLIFLLLTSKYMSKDSVREGILQEKEHKKLNIFQFFGNKYILIISAFIIVSYCSASFIDYSFLNLTTTQFDDNQLANFLSLFEGTIVILGFLIGLVVTERLQEQYGLRISLLVNPVVLVVFTLVAICLGYFWGFEPAQGATDTILFFFIAIAMCKLLVAIFQNAIDQPVTKLYYAPIEKSIKLDAQTKLEGVIYSFATCIAGGLIVLINNFKFFNLLSISMFTLILLIFWVITVNKIHKGYRNALQNSLKRNQELGNKKIAHEFTVESVLSMEVSSSEEDKIFYCLKLSEKLDTPLFESLILKLSDSPHQKVKKFIQEKIKELKIEDSTQNEILKLAKLGQSMSEDSDMLSISNDRLVKLSRSNQVSDRILVAKLLRKLINDRNIFILLELLRDPDPKVRILSINTARKVKRPETWPILIDMLSSPLYGNHVAGALREGGVSTLSSLDMAFYKSGQNEQVLIKIVQIIGHIGGAEAWKILWKKSDYPDKRIVKQIFFSLRFTNYQAQGRERTQVLELLSTEIGKTFWNLCAQEELPDEPEFQLLKDALKEELTENYQQLTLLLSILYDQQSIQLVSENIDSGTVDGMAYALELMDLFVDAEIKPKLFPIYDYLSIKNKMEKLQSYYPREKYTAIEVITFILNRDFNMSNRWTKMCAAYITAQLPDYAINDALIGQMFNPDPLIQETVAWTIFNKDPAKYRLILSRIPVRDVRFLDDSIQKNDVSNPLNDGYFLRTEIVVLLKSLPVFAGISGVILSDISERIKIVNLADGEKIEFSNSLEEQPVLIVASGKLKLTQKDGTVQFLNSKEVFGDFFKVAQNPVLTKLESVGKSIVFNINLYDAYFIMAKHHQLVQGLIRNITEDQMPNLSYNN